MQRGVHERAPTEAGWFRRVPRPVIAVLAAVITATGLVVGRVAVFEWDYHHVGRSVLTTEHAAISRARAAPSVCTTTAAGEDPITRVAGVDAYGELDALSIGLHAPVVQGTGDAQLAVAVGHDPSSVWPSLPGTTVLSAHDVTWSSHIDQLSVGQHLEFVSPCQTYDYRVIDTRVVKAGAPVLNQIGTLVLTTCYPLTALYLTPDRYVVEAKLVDVVDGAGQVAAAQNFPVPSVPAPAPLVAQGLGLANNDAPLGHLLLTGSPSPQWQQSSAPYNVESAFLSLYFAALRAAEQAQSTWWSMLAPSVPFDDSAAWWGASVAGNAGPVDITFAVDGDQVEQLSLTSSPTLTGGYDPDDKQSRRPHPMTYHVTLTALITDGVLQVTQFHSAAG
ncbi:MAG TPA: class D sortase [Acidimicrobiales bacterium]|nr:class D sortase [Acidimicrobiales bacterium]